MSICVIKGFPALLICLFFCFKRADSYEWCDFYSTCRDGYYCCNDNTQCCAYGDVCWSGSTYTSYCEQGQHCCGTDDMSCCDNTNNRSGATPAALSSLTTALFGSFIAWIFAKGSNSCLL